MMEGAGMADAGGWLRRVTGDAVVAERLAEPAQLADMLRIEAVYSRAAGRAGKVPSNMGEVAAAAIERVEIDRAALAKRAEVDGMPVPGLVAQIKAQVGEALHPAVHKGLTSQDVMDTALVLALRDILHAFKDQIGAVQDALADLDAAFGARPLMARTRMQAALPVTVHRRIAGWQAPFAASLERLEQMRPRLLRLQLGGPVGTRESFDGFGDAIAADMAAQLELSPGPCWHTDRTALTEVAGWCGALSGSLGKIGTDLCLMAQQGVEEIRTGGGGASSAMAHKSNPVDAEILVALARESAGLQATMQHALLHEQERSGAAWALEWLVLPRLLEGCGASLRLARRALGSIEGMGRP